MEYPSDSSDPDHGWLKQHVEGRTLLMVELLQHWNPIARTLNESSPPLTR